MHVFKGFAKPAIVTVAASNPRIVRKPYSRLFPFAWKANTSQPIRRKEKSLVTARAASKDTEGNVTAETSQLVTQEVLLFLYQLELDMNLSRALTYEDFDTVASIRTSRRQVDDALEELQDNKGLGSGTRAATRSDEFNFDHAPTILRIRSEMASAVEEERYSDAAKLRDELRQVEEMVECKVSEASTSTCRNRQPQFALGESVLHMKGGYRGVVCGWDMECCESEEWRSLTGVSSLVHGTAQIYYHLLVDTRDWPMDSEQQPPIAYVAEELLASGSSANFDGNGEALVDGSFQHPFSYLMFLGPDGQGNLLPCRQLRDRYNVFRKDVYTAEDLEELESDETSAHWSDTDEDTGGGPPRGGNNRGGGGGSGGGGPSIPGIDMRSLM